MLICVGMAQVRVWALLFRIHGVWAVGIWSLGFWAARHALTLMPVGVSNGLRFLSSKSESPRVHRWPVFTNKLKSTN